MINYNFSTLNDKEFEHLVLDLLNAEFNLGLQNFKAGKDGGIDFRFSTPSRNNSIVVQVKHYYKSGYSGLKSKLKNKELPKVNKLKPERYIIVTSIPLSAKEKDELKEIFSPFIKSSNDVIDNENLNSYLRKHKDVIKTHFKLWFSSTEIISTILNNAIETRTKNYLQRISNKFPLYVITKNLDKSLEILATEKILLITGQPGVGKTTLAEILLYYKAKQGSKVYKINTIRDAEDVISLDDNEQQIFYFDDFLGEVYYEILAGSQKEGEIANFVEAIKHTPNKYIILSTRTVILEQAKNKSEKIKRSKLEGGKYEIKLNKYSKLEKAKILYNHLYFNNLKEDLLQAILKEKFYYEIINNNNYTPRIVEFITDKSRIQNYLPQQYLKFITKNLTNPEEIWEHSFFYQINYFDRCFLYTLFTLKRNVTENQLFIAFTERLEHEKKNYNKQLSSEQFNSCIKSLLNGFITSSIIDVDNNIKTYSFINPSLSDYILGLLHKDFKIRKDIISSVKYIEQLDYFNPDKTKITLEEELQIIIREKIKTNQLSSYEEKSKVKINGIFLEILIKYCPAITKDAIFLAKIKQIDLKKIGSISSNLEFILLNIHTCQNSYNYIKINFEDIISSYITYLPHKEKASNIKMIFEAFNFDYQLFLENHDGFELINNLIHELISNEELDIIYNHIDNISSFNEEEDIERLEEDIDDDLNDLQYELSSKLLPNISLDYYERSYNQQDLLELVKKNIVDKKNAQKIFYERKKQIHDEFNLELKQERKLIHNLFNHFPK